MLLRTLKHRPSFHQMILPCFIQQSVLFTCPAYYLKTSARYTTGQSFGMLLSASKHCLSDRIQPQERSSTQTYSTYLKQIHINTKHLGLLLYHTLSWHTRIVHLHQKAMTKITLFVHS